MSLLDDAQEIARNGLQTLTVTGTMVCVFCGRNPCRSSCVRHSLPRIVAALEAAQEYLALSFDRVFDVDYSGQGRPHRCRVCLAEQSPYEPLNKMQHKPDCRFATFVEAIQGT